MLSPFLVTILLLFCQALKAIQNIKLLQVYSFSIVSRIRVFAAFGSAKKGDAGLADGKRAPDQSITQRLHAMGLGIT